MGRLSTGPQTPVSTFYTALKTYNASQIQSSFASTAFSCAICLEDRKGKGCIQMPGCGCVLYVLFSNISHVAVLMSSCVPCLSSGWSLAITEGSLENVFCPSLSCTKERATKEGKVDDGGGLITASLVETVVGKSLRERWEWITENRRAETGKLAIVK
jgi:E3 ubiquitin-protein ligase RNF14